MKQKIREITIEKNMTPTRTPKNKAVKCEDVYFETSPKSGIKTDPKINKGTINTTHVNFPSIMPDQDDFCNMFDKQHFYDEYDDGMKNQLTTGTHLNRITSEIDAVLSHAHPQAAKWNQIEPSQHLSNTIGVVARAHIICGTVVGYSDGKPSCGDDAVKQYRFGLKDPVYAETDKDVVYIDGSAVDSCYGRYYVCSPEPSLQNISVLRLRGKRRFNKVICFIAHKDIAKGHELLIALDQDFGRIRFEPTHVARHNFTDDMVQTAVSLYNGDR